VKHDWRDAKPAWSLLYVIVLLQTGLLAVIEVSIPPGIADSARKRGRGRRVRADVDVATSQPGSARRRERPTGL